MLTSAAIGVVGVLLIGLTLHPNSAQMSEAKRAVIGSTGVLLCLVAGYTVFLPVP